MRDREETFITSPKEVFQQETLDMRINSLVQKVNLLEEKVNAMSKMLLEILRRTETSKSILEPKTRKAYGFEPEDEVD